MPDHRDRWRKPSAGICAAVILLVLASCAVPGTWTSGDPSPLPRGVGREVNDPAVPSPVSGVDPIHGTVEVDGQPRTYQLHVPPVGPAGRPLVVALHGKGSSPELMRQRYGLDTAASARDMSVAYLRGLHQGWGTPTQPTELRPDPRADVDFTRAVIDDLARRHRIDDRRVYVVGMSDGGGMALRLAAEHPSWLAAVATVSGQLSAPPNDVRPSGPIPVLSIYGDRDPLRPIGGLPPSEARELTMGQEPMTPTLSTRTGLEEFAGAAGAVRHQYEEQPRAAPEDGTSTTRETWTDTDGDTPVVSYTVRGGGHAWPGVPAPVPSVGPVSQQLDGTATVLDFFAEQRKSDG